VICFILILTLFVGIDLHFEFSQPARGTVIYVGGTGGGNLSTIQEGIDAASPGNAVFVYNGTYDEDVIINKSIMLTGENQDITIINGTGIKNVVLITADWINVTGFTITNSGDIGMGEYAGIKLIEADNCRIFNNNISSNNANGIQLDGSSNNEIINNNINSNKWCGIYLKQSNGMSSSNNITNNTISGNSEGIYMISPLSVVPSNCDIIDNTISGNSGGGIRLYTSIGNNILNNNISNNGGGIYPWLASNDNQIAGNNVVGNGDGISFDASDHNNVINNNITNNDEGIMLSSFSSNNKIENNNVSSNTGCGFLLSWSGINVITDNLITYNDRSFDLFDSPYNLIYHNNIIQNNLQPQDDNFSNLWNDTYPLGGNYWSDYSGVDLYKGPNQDIPGSDGIGDIPYFIDPDNQDNYPLMGPYPSFPTQNYSILKKGWNLISIPLIQEEQNLTRVLGSIDTWYDAVQWYDNSGSKESWKYNKLGKPFGNDLAYLNESLGFWIHITKPGDTIFLLNGTQPTSNHTIQLYKGWNMVGYPSLTNHNRTVGLNQLDFSSDVDCIQWFDSLTKIWQFMGENDSFEIGRGYWIHATSDCVWEVPL
jgi:parallel beta-helix repeat protein